MKKNNTKNKMFNELRKALLREVADYTKAVKCETRKRPVYLEKHSDIAVDKMRDAFEQFIHAERK
jgi:hypothetical protein